MGSWGGRGVSEAGFSALLRTNYRFNRLGEG